MTKDPAARVAAALVRAQSAVAALAPAINALKETCDAIEAELLKRGIKVEARVAVGDAALLWCRLNGQWRFVVERVARGDTASTRQPLCNASREQRIACADALPDLIEAIATAAEAMHSAAADGHRRAGVALATVRKAAP